jgi:transcriptional regulator
LDGRYDEVVALREKGYIYKDIAYMLKCSHTLLRTFVKKHKAYEQEN